MRFKLLIASFVLLIAQSAFATNHTTPTACPSVDAFKNIGVSSVIHDEDGSWITLEWKNRFGTEDEWTFMVGDIKADSQSEALAKGNAYISELRYKYGPTNMGSQQDPMWYCVYQDPNSGVFGAALTPPATPEISKMMKFMRKK